MPTFPFTSPVAPAIDHTYLDDLPKNLITDEEYQAKRKAILDRP